MMKEKVFSNAITAKYDAWCFATKKGKGAFVDGPFLREVLCLDGKVHKSIVWIAYYNSKT